MFFFFGCFLLLTNSRVGNDHQKNILGSNKIIIRKKNILLGSQKKNPRNGRKEGKGTKLSSMFSKSVFKGF